MELNDNVTEIGVTILPAKLAREYAEHLGLEGMLQHTVTHHWRVLEHCHMRNKLPKLNPGAERNFLFAHTRFVKKAEITGELIKVFHGRSKAGSKAPVILIGHAIWHDTHKIKRRHGLDVEKIPNIIFQIKGMDELAMSLGIQESKNGSLSKILQSFGVDERWHHNAANDAIYTLLPTLRITRRVQLLLELERP